MKKIALVTLLTLGSFNVFANDSHFTEYVGASGKINWTKATVEADGYGAAPVGKNPKLAPILACRAAIVDAQRNLLESFQGVRVTATTLVSNYMLTSDQVKSSVEGTVKGATIKHRENLDNQTCKVTLEAAMRGKPTQSIFQNLYQEKTSALNLMDFLSVILPNAHAASTDSSIDFEAQLTALKLRVDEIDKLLELKSQTNVTDTMPSITGLIIDVRGNSFIPSLNPTIRKLSGEVLYPDQHKEAQTIDNGQLVSLFATAVDFAMDHPLVGNNPLLIKAQSSWGSDHTAITLEASDAAKLMYLAEKNLLSTAGVIIVLD